MNCEQKTPHTWRRKPWNASRSRGRSLGSQDGVSAEEAAKRDARQRRFESTSTSTSSSSISSSAGENSRHNRKHYGLVSRGQESVLQHSQKERETFFTQIIESFVRYCNTNLTTELRAIEIPTSPSSQVSSSLSSLSSPSLTTSSSLETAHELDINLKLKLKLKHKNNEDEGNLTQSLELILADLRKLRELLVANEFSDFTKQVYLFSIRISTSIGHYQSYFPSVVHLLAHEDQLSSLETAEIASILVLHLSHHNNANGSALAYFYKYVRDDHRLLEVLTSWIAKDYYLWVRLYNGESNPAKLRLMRFGLKTMVSHLVACVERLYFTLPCAYMDEILPNGVSMAILEEEYNVLWKRQNNMLVVRERKSMSK